MTTFFMLAGLLTAATLLCLLPALLRHGGGTAPAAVHDELNLALLREQMRELDAELAAGGIGATEHESARQELARRVAGEVPATRAADSSAQAGRAGRGTALLLALAVPLLALALYLMLGNPAGLDPARRAQGTEPESAHAVSAQQMDEMVSALAQKLRQAPDDADGWRMLARSYQVLERYAEAAEAYARLLPLIPENAAVLSDYADTLASTRDGKLQGEPEQLLARALRADPRHIKALDLAGSAALQRGDNAAALVHWQKMLELVAPDSASAARCQGNIDEVQRRIAAVPAQPRKR